MMKEIILKQHVEMDTLLSRSCMERHDILLKPKIRLFYRIKLFTGPRRSGKTALALRLLKDKPFAYLNFDDDVLLKHFDEDAVLESLNEVYPNFRYLLLKEIQNLRDWETWVDKLLKDKDFKLVITASNVRLLTSVMDPLFTKRFHQIVVFPFSFEEFLRQQSSNSGTLGHSSSNPDALRHSTSIPDALRHSTSIPDALRQPSSVNLKKPSSIGEMLRCLSDYMVNGGFPEVVMNPSLGKSYLSTVFDSVLLKDIVRHYQIRNVQQLYDLSNYLLYNFAIPCSYTQLKDNLNFKSVLTVQRYVDYLSESGLFRILTKYSGKKLNPEVSNHIPNKAPKKIYLVDNGFIQSCSFELSRNFERLLENIVFQELLRRGFQPELDLFYYKARNSREIDFVCLEGRHITRLIQVCYNDLSGSKILKQKAEALVESSFFMLRCSELLVITWTREETMQLKGQTIRLVPAWKWLLDLK